MYRPKAYFAKGFGQQYSPNCVRGPYHSPSPGFTDHGRGEYWCETCDRGFPSAYVLEKHKAQHQKCNIDGCQFVAHPKVITKHIQMQHATGLYKKIAKLDNPEEVQKWREERKKKYPTQFNIDKKAAEKQEKIDRGEKMYLKQDKHKRNVCKPGGQLPHSRSQKNDNKFKRHKKKRFERKENVNVNKVIIAPEKINGLQPFLGIQDLIMNSGFDENVKSPDNFLIDDDDDYDCNSTQTNALPEKKPMICGALNNLICNYGSSDEEIEIKNPDNTQKFENGKHIPVSQVQYNKILSDDESGPEEVKTDKISGESVESNTNEIENSKSSTKTKTHFKDKQKPRKQQVVKRYKPQVPSTLLQKLLFKEMRQERNMILQCIRYTISKNFFDVLKS